MQERQAQLEAEQQHKQSLLQQLEERHAHTEELRQQHEAQREELMQQLATYQQQADEAAQSAQVSAVGWGWLVMVCSLARDGSWP